MATTFAIPLSVPGLHAPPSLPDLRESTRAYNSLPDDCDQPYVSEIHLKDLAEIFKQHNVQSKFGLHLIHGHLTLQKDTIMLGQAMNEPSGCWTKPVGIHDVNLNDIHRHLFRLVADDRIVAYEYRDGAPADMKSVYPAFFYDYINYLKIQNRTNLLGLQAACEIPATDMVEFMLGETGTVMLNKDSAKDGGIYRATGWFLGEQNGDLGSIERDAYAKTTKGTHRVFVSKAPSNLDGLARLLHDEDLVQ